MSASKSVFISYCHKNENAALELASKIQDRLGEEVWIDFFDLDAGDEFALKITGAIQKANWFVLIASEDAYRSKWIRYEAGLATYQSIEKDDFRIITLRIDNSPVPDHLRLVLETRICLDGTREFSVAADKLVQLIAKETTTRSGQRAIFFNRGREIDSIQLQVEGSKAIFVAGVYGIGKSSLVEEAIRTRLGRPFFKITIRKGHDSEILTRQLISLSGLPQPSKDASDLVLSEVAFEGFRNKQVENGTLLILDDVENALDEEGKLRAFIIDFVQQYIKRAYRYPVFLIMTRKAEIPLDILEHSFPLVVDKLDDQYIPPLIQHWYKASKGEDANLDLADLNKLASNLGGHPLAARLITSYLILYSTSSVLRSGFISEFKLRVAEHILRDILSRLTQLDKTILQIIAVAELGITVEDIAEASILKTISLDVIQRTVNRLTDAMLISQDADLLKLHSFIQEYFLRDAETSAKFKGIAGDMGNKMFQKMERDYRELNGLGKNADPKTASFLNHKVFQHAISSHRLLLFSGQEEKAERIPFRLSGHLRELVLITYQRFQDYPKTLLYANRWLSLDPNDSEINLYKARALRKLERYEEASQILLKLSNIPDRGLKAKVDRERGLIAKDNNKIGEAIKHFRKASIRNASGAPVYAIALADLANALIIEAESLAYEDIDEEEVKGRYEEALRLLTEARDYLPRFEDVHISYFVDALIHLGRAKDAEGLLNRKLDFSPNDPHLLLKKANVLSKIPGRNKEALEYAELALASGLDWAYTIKAKILFDDQEYAEALTTIQSYNPKNPRDKIFVTDLKAKILIALDRFDEARGFLKTQNIQNNRFIDYLWINNEIKCGDYSYNRQLYEQAKSCAENAKELFARMKASYRRNQAMIFLEEEIRRLEEKVNKNGA